MGRPIKSAHERKTEKLDLRLTTAEKAHVEKQAAMAGMSVAEYARQVILGHRVRAAQNQRGDAAVLSELNRIGVELGRIAKPGDRGCNPDALDGLSAALAETLAVVAGRYGP